LSVSATPKHILDFKPLVLEIIWVCTRQKRRAVRWIFERLLAAKLTKTSSRRAYILGGSAQFFIPGIRCFTPGA